MTKHFELTDETVKTLFGESLYRIRALIDMPKHCVNKGDMGGFVQTPNNLQGDAWIYGDARVYGAARVSGNARVSGDADMLTVGPALSSGRYTTAHRDGIIGVRVVCGCFSGTVKEFSAAIETTHAGNALHLKQYRLFRQMLASNFESTT